MPVLLPSENSNIPLSLVQWEAIIKVHFREFVSATISGDILSIPGSGRYKVLPQSGTVDQITSITLTGENVEGTTITLKPETIGHTITLVHGGGLHLLNGNNVELTTIHTTVKLWHEGSGIWAQDGPVSYCP